MRLAGLLVRSLGADTAGIYSRRPPCWDGGDHDRHHAHDDRPHLSYGTAERAHDTLLPL